MLEKTIYLRFGLHVACCLLVLTFAAACERQQQEELRGKLYFGAGQYLAKLDLRRGTVDIDANIGDVEIRAISPQRDSRLLLTVFGSINHQDRYSLVLYDLATRQTLTIAYGRNGHYLPGTEVLVYDDGVSLILAERDGDEWQKTEILRHSYNATPHVAPVSATRFLYTPAGQAIHLYDTVSQRAIELAQLGQQCRLDASLWDPQRERLLCRKRLGDGEFEYLMVGLDGTVMQALPLPHDRRMQPVAFLSDQDALVLTEQWRAMLSDRQQHAVWVFRFDSGAFYRLVDNQHLGRSVVYKPR